MGNTYRRYTTRDYNEFDVEQFVELVENELEYNRDRNVNANINETSMMRFMDNMVQALDIVAPKKQFRISKVWKFSNQI